jgi:hypothetical protein
MSRSFQESWRLVVCDAPKEVLDAKAKLVALVLSTYANPDGTEVRPGEDRLVDDTGLSVRSVRRAMARLRGLGLLQQEVYGQRFGRQAIASKYRLWLPAAYLDAVEAAGTEARVTRVRQALQRSG